MIWIDDKKIIIIYYYYRKKMLISSSYCSFFFHPRHPTSSFSHVPYCWEYTSSYRCFGIQISAWNTYLLDYLKTPIAPLNFHEHTNILLLLIRKIRFQRNMFTILELYSNWFYSLCHADCSASHRTNF